MEELSELTTILESLLQDTEDFKELLDPKPEKPMASVSSSRGSRVGLFGSVSWSS